MGQGFSATTLSAGSAGIDVPELSDLTYEKSLGNARFMKCIRARQENGLVIAKVVAKPYADFRLDKYVKTLLAERKELTDIPNALGHHRILETSSNGYLVRQYIFSSLYDRMSTRPFLEVIEKKWLAFQLLCAVRDCHARNIYHGDIKTENILVTSWNWLYLTDFSSCFKPTYLPEDNPADFSFFFDTSGRRTCYLAPERFLKPGEDAKGKGPINWAMDIFSVGCVIAELFAETPIFSLSQLFKYRANKEFDPEHSHLNRIADREIREMVAHMIQLDPQTRYSAEEYLSFWRHKAFPDYFYSFLHQYMFLITDPTSGRSPLTAGKENLGESDDRIDRVYYDFDKISFLLGYQNGEKQVNNGRRTTAKIDELFPLQIDIPNNIHEASVTGKKNVDDGTLLFLTLVLSSLRSTARANARLKACELLLAFAERVTDETKLDRILPYLVVLLNDKTDAVKVAALRTLTQVLALVNIISPINAYVFPDYVVPRLQSFAPESSAKPSAWVRATYASCLGSLASTASRFLGMMEALRADGSLPKQDPEVEEGALNRSLYQTLYEVARGVIVEQLETHVKALLTDSDPSVRRAFLGSVSSLCVFFGSTKASDVILSHLNTYLNDQDWMLKCKFFETIVGVATYIGSAGFEEFILPLMVQALTDPEEFVVERVLRSFSAIAHLGLFQRSNTWELLDIVARFTMHPNIWIREAAAEFISSSTRFLSMADCHGIVIPLIRIYFKVIPSDLSELSILDALKKPLSRITFDMALSWATKVEKGLFWKPAEQQRTFAFGTNDDMLPKMSGKDLTTKAFARVPKNDEDDKWIWRLRNGGMGSEDEVKFLALREYIWRVAHRKLQEDPASSLSTLSGIMTLTDLKVSPQTIFFDADQDLYRYVSSGKDGDQLRPRTIVEALQDAAMPLNGHTEAQKMNRTARNIDDALPLDDPFIANSPGVTSPTSPTTARAEPSSSANLDDTRKGPLQLTKSFSKSSNNTLEAEHIQALHRKGSAISLIGKTDTASKALPETSTTPTNAFGQVERAFGRAASAGRSSPLTTVLDEHQRPTTGPRPNIVHTYAGHDPNVLKLLDSLYLENYPTDYMDFGPLVQPSNLKRPIQRPGGSSNPYWRPEGLLVAMLGEHTDAVRRIAIAPDQAFFITGSDDGSVKVWDSSRLEKNVAHRSRQTHRHASGVNVTALCFVENTHCFISTGSDGSVHAVKVDFTDADPSPRYGKLKVVREYQLSDDQHAVWIEHYKADNHSMLVIGTSKSRVIALDLRTMSTLFEFQSPLHHGTVTCFIVDKRHHWLLLSTSHGVLSLWDLRFRIRVKSWTFPNGYPIHRLVLVPGRSPRRNRIAVAGGSGSGEVTIWDLEKLQWKEAYRTGLAKQMKAEYKLIDLDEAPTVGALRRFGTSSEPNVGTGSDRCVQAITMGSHYPEDGSEARHFFLLSAGPDWKVRFWDPGRCEASMVVSGLEVDEGKPTYRTSQLGTETISIQETLHPAPPDESSPAPKQHSASLNGKRSPRSQRRASGKHNRSSIISLQQQHLLKSHLDNIEDVALLEYPYGMVISADRSGVVYIFS